MLDYNINYRKEVLNMARKGETPGEGKYRCMKCGLRIKLESNDNALENCSKCNYGEWAKIGTTTLEQLD